MKIAPINPICGRENRERSKSGLWLYRNNRQENFRRQVEILLTAI